MTTVTFKTDIDGHKVAILFFRIQEDMYDNIVRVIVTDELVKMNEGYFVIETIRNAKINRGWCFDPENCKYGISSDQVYRFLDLCIENGIDYEVESRFAK